MESLAKDCIKEFATANIHSILQVPNHANPDQLRYAIREYLRKNHPDKAGNATTAKTQVVTRFNLAFQHANSFLSYILLPNVREFYLSEILKSTIDSYKSQITQLRTHNEYLNGQVIQSDNEWIIAQNRLYQKEGILQTTQAQLKQMSDENERLKIQLQMLSKINSRSTKDDVLEAVKCDLREKVAETEALRKQIDNMIQKLAKQGVVLAKALRQIHEKERQMEQLKDKTKTAEKVALEKEAILDEAIYEMHKRQSQYDNLKAQLRNLSE